MNYVKELEKYVLFYFNEFQNLTGIKTISTFSRNKHELYSITLAFLYDIPNQANKFEK